MSLCDATLHLRAEADPRGFTCDDRQWRVRGLETRRSDLRLRVNLLVTRCAHQHRIARHEVRFTQRQLRETLHWNDRALRRQLTRLVELEYVVAYRSGQGNGRMYQLLYEPRREDGPSWQLGLSDVEQLRAASQKLPCSLLAGRIPPCP
jgi:hypothetical protein